MTNWWVYQHLSLNIAGHTWCWKKDNASKDQYTWCNRKHTHTHIISDNLRIYDYICIYIYVCIIRYIIYDNICIYIFMFNWLIFLLYWSRSTAGSLTNSHQSPQLLRAWAKQRWFFAHEFVEVHGGSGRDLLTFRVLTPKKVQFLKKILPEKRPDDLWP